MRQRRPSSSLQNIIAALQSGDVPQGEQLVRQALRTQPRDADILHLSGAACLMQGKYAEARDLLRRALGIRKDATFYANLALADLALDSFPCTSHTTAAMRCGWECRW